MLAITTFLAAAEELCFLGCFEEWLAETGQIATTTIFHTDGICQ
jgi:hypothetical protein